MTRPVAVLPPPGAEYLRFHKMEGQEELGRLFRFEVELFSTEPEVELGTLIGKSIAVRLERDDRLEVGGSRTETIGGPAMVTAATVVFDGQGGIELVSGGSSIKITPGGIMLSGPQVKVAGEGVVNVTAGGVLSLSGALIKQG